MIYSRIICFDIDSGKKEHEITNPNMRTVYAIYYDQTNQVIHAATGKNNVAKPICLTFDASKDKFGELVQIWDANSDVKFMFNHL